MSLLQNEDKKVTLFDDANSGFKEHGQGKREREMSREVRIYGGRQYEAAQPLPCQLLGKNKLLRRYIHKQNLNDSIG